MSADSLDELVELYRHSALEHPSPAVDRRILAAAKAARRQRISTWHWAVAAAILLAAALPLAFHTRAGHPHSYVGPSRPVPVVVGDPATTYLLQMDVTPTSSPVARYLLTEASPPADKDMP